MYYMVKFIELDGTIQNFHTGRKKDVQSWINNNNDVIIKKIIKVTNKTKTNVTHLFDIRYFADSEEYLAEQEKEYLDKLDNIPEYDPYNVKEYFIGEEYYKGYGFYREKRIEKLLWRVYDLIRYTPVKIDYENTIDLIIKEDKQLSIIDSKYKPFSDTDKKIFNSQILLSRLKGLVIFEMWKRERGC